MGTRPRRSRAVRGATDDRTRPGGVRRPRLPRPRTGGRLADQPIRPAPARATRPAGDALPVALVLHGRGGDARSAFDDLSLDGYLADAVQGGAPAFALASVDGGDSSYWHRRRGGDDPQAMLVEEFLPLLADRGLRTTQVAVLGWSMGGYGALLLAETLGPSRIAAVAADSPALWQRSADSAAGAFDGAADFAAHDVVAGRERLTGIRCGSPAATATRSTRRWSSSPAPSRTWPARTWAPARTPTRSGAARAPAQLRFLASALSR